MNTKNIALELAQKLYNAQLPYHNFEHALNAIDAGEKMIKACKKENINVDEDVVYYALLFHDAGYHEDYRLKGFDSKESYAAYLAKVSLKEIGIDNDSIKEVERAIISTHQKESFKTNEQKIVRAADLAGMTNDYEIFLENNRKLRKEHKLLTGEDLSIDEWKAQTRKIIGFYLSQNIQLTSKYVDVNGESIFHKKAAENLTRFCNEI